MNRWSALALLLAVAGALALRVPKLDTRPLHNDEAVNAVKVAELWQHGRYKYDPDEYHGPTLHYATLPFLWLSGARDANEVKDATLRLAPVVSGSALILLLVLFVDGLGRPAVIWAALFIAVSPAMVFYSRYSIHEMPLVFFTVLTMGAGWRYTQARRGRATLSTARRNQARRVESLRRAEDSHAPPAVGWAVLTGAALGLMFATKETFVLSLAAMGLALPGAIWSLMPKGAMLQRLREFWNWNHIALALGAMLLVWLLFFSSFFTNFAGLLDSVRTYLPWLRRAGGHSPHIHPWHFYLERLAWFHPAKGPAWSEGLILALALVGTVIAFVRKNPLHRFLALYTIALAAIYSTISYKTPWCLLSFFLGMILLAGIGATALVEFFRARSAKFAVSAVLLIGTAQLAWQCWRASFIYAADRRNPYVYAQTVPDLLNLIQRTEAIARVAPAGFDTVVKVIAPESDYWPLPWYLRRFQNVGWYDRLPEDPFAPIIIVSSKLDARLDDKSNRKWLMVGLTELRPGKFLELYVELELWKKYVETLPRERE
jgi:uncharacterized protein (TIGR03663 family)